MQCAIQCTNCTQKSELKFLMKMLEHILIPHCFTAEEVGANDTQIDSIQYLNFNKKLFNSIFNSILFHKNSIQKII